MDKCWIEEFYTVTNIITNSWWNLQFWPGWNSACACGLRVTVPEPKWGGCIEKKKCYQCPVSNSINKNVSCGWKKKVSVDSSQTRQQFRDSRSQLLWLSHRRRCRAIFRSLSGGRVVTGSQREQVRINREISPWSHASPRRWQALIMAAAVGGGRLEVRRAVFLRVTPAFCASLRIVPYALSE